MEATSLRALFAAWLLLLLTTNVLGQNVLPSNDTSTSSGNVQFSMDTVINNMGVHVAIEPLTNDAGLAGSLNDLQQIQPSGPLFLTTGENIGNVGKGSISFISCEPSDYTTAIGSSRTIQLAAANNPNAIVLYSTYASLCTFQPTPGFTYVSLYTMLDARSSLAIVNGLKSRTPQDPTANLRVNQTTVNGTSTSNSNILGKSPTTAVAMIILYSITGIITALFLIIIIVGAIRAHRHPERYGPRHIIGRPRQSRAKGIARAMLETLPIVKFGDREEEDKPPEAARDIEMGAANAKHQDNTDPDSEHSDAAGASSTTQSAPTDGPDVVTTEFAAASAPPSKENKEPANPVDNGLACSVCTDDFVKGQDIRVLPCKHKFHPECIDPWLLNVSGTCPLCRIDLHPTTSNNGAEQADDGPSLDTRIYSDQTPPPEIAGNETTRQNRRSRILSTLNIGRMRHATPQERIEVLRTLRSEGMTGVDRPEQGGQAGGDRAINRFSRRLSRALGSRPTSGVPSSRPVSEVPPAATSPESDLQPHLDPRRQGSFAG